MLAVFYEIMSNSMNRTEGSLWASLSQEEKEDLIQVEIESHIDDNLIPHSEILAKHIKWL